MSDDEILLVRHAKAGDRELWTQPDRLRPLTPAGRRQAERLVELFAERPLVRLMSSPFLRCVQTLEPLAAARGLVVEERDELAEGEPWELIERLVLEAAADGPGALCIHGDVLQLAVEDLLDRGVRLLGNVVEYRKGATWVLGVRDGGVVTARYVAPPPHRTRSLAS